MTFPRHGSSQTSLRVSREPREGFAMGAFFGKNKKQPENVLKKFKWKVAKLALGAVYELFRLVRQRTGKSLRKKTKNLWESLKVMV